MNTEKVTANMDVSITPTIDDIIRIISNLGEVDQAKIINHLGFEDWACFQMANIEPHLDNNGRRFCGIVGDYAEAGR